MAAGGVDPDEDVRLVVLPPPYMVESLANGHVDGFCVGAPWNSVAVDLGIGHILHFVLGDPGARRREGAGGARALGEDNPDVLRAAGARASRAPRDFVEDVGQPRRGRGAPGGAEPHRRRAGGDPPHARRPSEGRARRHHARRDRYLLIGRDGAGRPDPVQAAWLYAQMVRWGQAPLSEELLPRRARRCSGPIFTTPRSAARRRLRANEPRDGIGAFVGPAFDAGDIAGHLAAWQHQAGRQPAVVDCALNFCVAQIFSQLAPGDGHIGADRPGITVAAISH